VCERKLTNLDTQAVDEVLATLSDEQLFTLLLRLRDWNTNNRTAVRNYATPKFKQKLTLW